MDRSGARPARIFVSHVGEEADLARRLKTELERAVAGAEVFVSASDIRLGEAWLREIDDALADAKALLVLCSRRSAAKPWITFESGAGWGRGLPVIPICHAGLRKEALPYPLSIFQTLELERAEDCHELARRVAEIVGTPLGSDFDAGEMATRLAAVPERTAEIGIVLVHGQGNWRAGPGTVFALANGAAPHVGEGWRFRNLERRDDLNPATLDRLAGLIVASPWRSRIEPDEITTMTDWVFRGGRMLLLGFEFGDRHHTANLNELSTNFGIRFATDIVGPAGGTRKPYGVPVDFEVGAADPHRLTEGLTTIRLPNVQTIRVEPGACEWLRVGRNSIYRPSGGGLYYRDGILTQPGGGDVEEIANAPWVPVAAEAPPGLGAGAVHAVGTWDLLGPNPAGGDANATLVARLLDWLSGDTRG